MNFVLILIIVFCGPCLFQNVTDDLAPNVILNNTKMEGMIAGGRYTSILNHPFVASLAIYCQEKIKNIDEEPLDRYICGATIVNQHFLVTAAHCLDHCHPLYSYVNIAVGTEHVDRISKIAESFDTHGDYEFEPVLKNDIGLVKVDMALTLGKKIMRAIIMRNCPLWNFGFVTGWGIVNFETKEQTKYLKEAKQSIPDRSNCLEVFPRMHSGCLCTKPAADGPSGYPLIHDGGDSGSGFIVNKTILMGLVSYRRYGWDWSVHVNLTYYYDWIHKTMAKMLCRKHTTDIELFS